eukprot:scaffold2236_cov385-Prasinococcus_capsulatus_cf.AAC.3
MRSWRGAGCPGPGEAQPHRCQPMDSSRPMSTLLLSYQERVTGICLLRAPLWITHSNRANPRWELQPLQSAKLPPDRSPRGGSVGVLVEPSQTPGHRGVDSIGSPTYSC